VQRIEMLEQKADDVWFVAEDDLREFMFTLEEVREWLSNGYYTILFIHTLERNTN
jgi:hypothetical protein